MKITILLDVFTIFRITFIIITLSIPKISNKADTEPNVFSTIPNLSYQIIAQYPHDPQAFTQGLLINQGILYESTGLLKQSSLREVAINNGKVMRLIRLADHVFAEGLGIFAGKLYQLTWKAEKTYVYDLQDFKLLKTFPYQGEGWGLTSDEHQLIMSNGSHQLFYRDPETFQILRQVNVHYQNQIIKHLNELEYAQGFIYANVWLQPFILKIQPDSGAVVGKVDLSEIVANMPKANIDAVLNGIAYWPERNSFLVTGKLWPLVFELTLDSCCQP